MISKNYPDVSSGNVLNIFLLFQSLFKDFSYVYSEDVVFNLSAYNNVCIVVYNSPAMYVQKYSLENSGHILPI